MGVSVLFHISAGESGSLEQYHKVPFIDEDRHQVKSSTSEGEAFSG